MNALLPLLRAFVFRGLRQEKTRALLTVAGVALGVAVTVAVRLANRSSLDAFAAGIDAVSAGVSLEVYSPAGPLDENALIDLLWLGEYGTWSPVSEHFALLPDGGRGPAGEPTGEYLQCLGVDLLTDWPIRDYQTPEIENATAVDLVQLLRSPEAAVIARSLASKLSLEAGDTFEVLAADRVLTLTVQGILSDTGPARGSDGNFVLLDIAAAQTLFDSLGQLTRIDIKLHPGIDATTAEDKIATRLPASLAVRDPGDRYRQAQTMVAAFHFNLSALAALALIVGLFLIYNTTSFSVVRRRREIGRLRAVGTPRRLIFCLFLAEAAVLALPGVILGALAGRILAVSAVSATADTIQLFFVAEAASHSAASLALGPVEWFLAIGVAFPLCLAAALVPAREATLVPPAGSVRSGISSNPNTRNNRARPVAAVALVLVATALCLLDPPGDLPLYAMAAIGCLIAAATLFVTPALTAIGTTASRLLFRNHLTGQIAASNLSAAAPRLAVSVAALATSLGMALSVAVLVGSFRDTISYWLDNSLAGDLYVRPASANSPLSAANISEKSLAIIKDHPDIADTETISKRDIVHRGTSFIVAGVDYKVSAKHSRIALKLPRATSATELLASADPATAAFISEPFALRFDKRPGDTIELPSRFGTANFQVAGVYYDYSNTRGVVLVDQSIWQQHFSDDVPAASLIAHTRPGADPNTVKAELESSLSAAGHQLTINTTRGILDTSMEIFEATFAVTRSLQIIAVTVASLGIVATLLTLLLERQREIAMLRLIGATKQQLRQVVVIEASLVGAAAAFLGTLLGLALSAVLIFVINVQSFGWTIQFHLPATWIAQSAVFVVLGAAAAALWPAARAARTLPTHV